MRKWLAALEGYYGPPLDHDERVALVQFLAAHDYDAYAYSPKDDPFARARWREPYPADDMARFSDLVAVCDDVGLELAMTINPGLDWRVSDASEIDALTAKLEAFRGIGVRGLAVAWDDVPGEGATVGASHGGAVALAFERIGAGARWFTCPVDYAAREPTTYLRAFAATLPPEVGIVWTGPGIVSPTLTGADAAELSAALGRQLLFGENFPVNDGGMAHVLHLGPYPMRDASFVAATKGAVVNFMHRPRASRVGLAVAARYWRNPAEDRYATWEATLAEFPGLEPLARACNSWIDNTEPDRRLSDWADSDRARLEQFLANGCRDGLDPALAIEVEPWLAQWEAEATAMQAALWLLANDAPVSMEEVGALALAWYSARRAETQAFGVRFAYYPVSARIGDRLVSDPVAVVEGSNLTDRLCRQALDAVRV
ncbi:MAG TPA: beta-N-acetylglucosaminidase domain-containing protein [Acidimicrobiales bacterium]|nr:beta-N-acetylglucosaminidase domain-containing protein [Acidimicrobiales bacterium]